MTSSYRPLWITPTFTARRRAHECHRRSPRCPRRGPGWRRLPSHPIVCGCQHLLADPVYAAIERHRQAYDVFMDTWGQTNWATVYDRIKTDEEAAARHRRYCELETAEEEAFHALLATRPTTKAGVIACVEHVADCGLATDEMRAWLAMLVQSPLAS
jgi:hypothetical protein